MRIISLYDGQQQIAQYEFDTWVDGKVVTLGRSESTDWCFPTYTELSRHHLSIRKLGEELYLRDEQSSNGSFIDGTPLTFPVRMRAGVFYQAGRLNLCLEGVAASESSDHVDCSSVFPEPLGFAAEYTTAPIAPEAAPVFSLEPEPAEEAPVFSLEPEPVEEAPVFSLEPEPVEEAPVFSLEPEPAEEAPVFSLEPEPVEEAPAFSLAAEPVTEQSPSTPTVAPAAAAAVGLLAGCVRPLLPIAGVPKTGIPRDFELQVRTFNGQDQITVGEKLILQVFSTEPCQLLIFCREGNGTTSMLYPIKQQVPQTIPANTWTLIPDPENPLFEFEIDGPEGTDEIQVIARQISDSRIRKGSAKKAEKKATRWSHASMYIHVYDEE